MVQIIFLISLFRIDPNPPVIDTFDMLEVNHKCNRYGVVTMDQVIAWDWHQRHKEFHCQWWMNMGNSARERTEEGEAKWMKKRRDIADQIKDWKTRKDWLNNTHYRGEYVGGQYEPIKNWRTGYWEIKFDNRIVRAKIFRETYTNNDPEVDDRKEFSKKLRRGLREVKSTQLSQQWEEWQREILKFDISHP